MNTFGVPKTALAWDLATFPLGRPLDLGGLFATAGSFGLLPKIHQRPQAAIVARPQCHLAALQFRSLLQVPIVQALRYSSWLGVRASIVIPIASSLSRATSRSISEGTS
jgi:hypothetical protein